MREIHGMKGTPLYTAWMSMKNRCRYSNRPEFKNYGGRGIDVCEKWKHSFIAFMADMGSTYQPGLSLDRKDNDKGYSLENCHWIPKSEQSRNRSDPRRWNFMDEGLANNKSGFRGVSYVRSRKKWVAMISINRKQMNLGRYDTREQAYDAYLRASAKFRG